MHTLASYIKGTFQTGSGTGQPLVNPATEEVIATTSVEGLDLAGALTFARQQGGAALAELSFAQRGELLATVAARLYDVRDELLDIAMANGGNTRSDAKFDVDGASATFAAYAEMAKTLGDAPYLLDGDNIQIGRSPRLAGRHIYVPRQGVALLINAFNFPAWGFAEKAACAWLAGMPVMVKPATSSAWVTAAMVRAIADALPPGMLSLVCGSAHQLPAMLNYGDVCAFTGSAQTGHTLGQLPNVAERLVRLNVEADSLNAAVLGDDVTPGDDTYDMFVRQVSREITQKSGQKCTAVRRIFAPAAVMDQLQEDLCERLSQVVYGDPSLEGVRMGPVSTAQQLRDVNAGLSTLAAETTTALGGDGSNARRQHPDKGYFVPPTLLRAKGAGERVHTLEVFGPVATLLDSGADAAATSALLARGRGSLVCALYSDDRKWVSNMIRGVAPHHGRVVLGSKKIADSAPAPGMVLPALLHGGPGRAGDGQELGGLRGLALYCQRVAVQGARPILDKLLTK